MKRLIFTLVAMVAFSGLSMAQFSQAITIEPANATAYDTLTLKLNTNHTCPEGAFDTVTNVHIHSGVNVNGNRWQNVVGFDAEGVNGQSTALTQENDSIWSITYVPADFYGVEPGNFISEINAVFNNGTWDAQAKDFNADSTECADFNEPLAVNPVVMEPANATAFEEVTLKLNTYYTCPDSDFDTVTNVYMHSGVTIDGSGWQNVVAFDGEGADGTPTTFTQQEDSIWTKTFVPADYYGIENGTIVEGMNMVFNNGAWPDAGVEAKMMAADSSECLDIYVPLESNVGIGDDNSVQNQFSMYPNPTSNNLNIEGLDDVTRIEVYNTVGQRVNAVENINQSVKLETGNLETGVYFVNFYNEKGVVTTQKFMKR
ncbi:MAG: T9SS type A sorting domain-containing protein [Bacteroidales bacterium]|nr:T9SS type A sorting domain-containing protein [Bacteroidales bacterium]MCF8337360.1 T9SS type A sorting domain-containing protein [Bacteroidales bacterium]